MVEAVPIFYQEVVPLARTEAETGLPAWPADEITEPLRPAPGRYGSTDQ
jgi:hypothetical protein